MTIIANAPVVAADEIEIAAPPEVVWEVMAAIDGWPAWNPDVTWASLDGELAAGTKFRWKAGPGMIISTLRRVEPPRALAWSGSTLGIDAVHVWRLEPRGGGTLVRTEESWEGLVARILRGRMQKMLEDAIASGLRHLKAEAEQRSASQPTT
jgi:uncharacterized protein YndB with AHSA1/START domain